MQTSPIRLWTSAWLRGTVGDRQDSEGAVRKQLTEAQQDEGHLLHHVLGSHGDETPHVPTPFAPLALPVAEQHTLTTRSQHGSTQTRRGGGV